jgi:hypothetical protein
MMPGCGGNHKELREEKEEDASGSLNYRPSTVLSMGIAEARDPSEMSN